jgi:hypothetical protein
MSKSGSWITLPTVLYGIVAWLPYYMPIDFGDDHGPDA